MNRRRIQWDDSSSVEFPFFSTPTILGISRTKVRILSVSEKAARFASTAARPVEAADTGSKAVSVLESKEKRSTGKGETGTREGRSRRDRFRAKRALLPLY